MAEAPTFAPSGNGTAVAARTDDASARKQELARALVRKVAQGFEIESETETHAVLVMRGRRRWLGLANAPSVRYEVTVDDDGRVTSRRV